MIGPPVNRFTLVIRKRLAEEIATALKAQGYRVTKNAVGDNSVCWPCEHHEASRGARASGC